MKDFGQKSKRHCQMNAGSGRRVRAIKRRLQNGEVGTIIARRFCVSKQTISAIKLGHIWSSV